MQCELFGPRFKDAGDLKSFLDQETGHIVDVKITRNRTAMLSIRFPAPGKIALRLHEHYLSAPEETFVALRNFIKNRRRSDWRIAASFVRHIPAAAIANAKPVNLNASGQFHDLAAIFREVNAEFFNGRVSCRIGWGACKFRTQTQFVAQVYAKIEICAIPGRGTQGGRLIRINPILDSLEVPGEFVKYIVFHEMLHAVVPPEVTASRRRDHTRQFKTLEKSFPGFDRMSAIADGILRKLP